MSVCWCMCSLYLYICGVFCCLCVVSVFFFWCVCVFCLCVRWEGRLRVLCVGRCVRVCVVRRVPAWCDIVVMFVSEFRSPSHMSGLNRSASLSYTERVDSVSISGSNSQLNNSPSAQYIPDFNVRALTDLQFVKVTYTCTHQTQRNSRKHAVIRFWLFVFFIGNVRSLARSIKTVSWRQSWTARRSPPRAATRVWTPHPSRR